MFRLQNLLTYPKLSVQLAAVKALGNLALNVENQKEMKVILSVPSMFCCVTFLCSQNAIPILLSFVIKEHPSEKMLLSTLLTLSNIAVLSDWHDEFYPALHALYNLVDTGSPQVKLQALKLLVNLSCNEDMVPSLLAAQVSTTLEDLTCKIVCV